MREIDDYFLNKEEPQKSCLLALREIILSYHPDISEAWKYRMPFFCYKRKMILYLWVNKKTNQPYIGIVDGKKIDHPHLVQEKRSRMKIFPVDVSKDIPIRNIKSVFKLVFALYS
jgi:hypothetical protein